MRLRAKRDLTIFVGVIFIISTVALLNNFFYRSSLAGQMEKYRLAVEKDRKNKGIEILSWKILQKTKGNMRTGPTFDESLIPYDKQRIHIVGFMVPLNQFRKMKEFLLLPLPIECYFCQAPPMRDVIIVQMAENETTDLYKEPVLINGILNLQKGKGVKFFYIISDAQIGPAREGGSLTRKTVAPQHMMHVQPAPQEQLLEGVESPAPTNNKSNEEQK
ncbi:MAG TPA: DUF3299 domain-containing protein [Candidatus Hydrogenedens sp.]|nr:DUF3299 domain-containing protein [Candidatus Hydrogenedens sp.]HOL20890.1 DUF3299 domain-containing protein [Candidatus Hydrogenedens sp.]HPP58645.1 DUF3299 domain-containing protein [Candidatus Hydrogenedens sp.]